MSFYSSLFPFPFLLFMLPQVFKNCVLPQADGFQWIVVLLTSLSASRRP